MDIIESQWLTIGLNKDTEDVMQNETNSFVYVLVTLVDPSAK